jgi:methionine-rich copper-binding protein CopC
MWLALLWSAVALAHAHLTGSSPADGSHVADAPTTLVLSFSEAARLTALAIAREGGAKQKLTAPAGAQARIRVTLPALAAGDYVVSWRALGADGHLVPGQIRFTIAPR